MKGGVGFAVVYLIGWVCYGEVAPTWLLEATAAVAFVVGVLVYIINPHVNGMDS
jgi:hypothetical protein